MHEMSGLYFIFYATCSSVVQVCVHDMPSRKNIDVDDIDTHIYIQKLCSCRKVQLNTLMQLKY